MALEKVPPASLESNEAVNRLFDYLEQRDADPRLTALAYPVLALAYRPRLVLPEGVGQVARSHIENYGQIALALDHTYGDDHVKWGGTTWHSSLHPMWRNSNIMAKAVLADEHDLLTHTLVKLGIITVFRTQDITNPRFKGVESRDEEPSEELKARHRLATRRAIQLGTDRLNKGNHHGSHVGGKRRNPNDPAPITPDSIKEGLFEMILGSDNPDNIMLLAGSLHKGGRYFRRSIMTLSHPIEHRGTAEEFKEPVAAAMQECREVAEFLASQERSNVVKPLTEPALRAAKLAWKYARG